MPRRDSDRWSAMCAQGKHGRCAGWMIVPNYSRTFELVDRSVKCHCPECKHPPVDPRRHMTDPDYRIDGSWNT